MTEITVKDFNAHYGTEYELLEQEFLDTLPYLTLDIDNRNAFSHAYIKIILQAGSMVDNIMKEYCRSLDPDFAKEHQRDEKETKLSITDLRNCIKKHESEYKEFCEQEIIIIECGDSIKPWREWSKDNSPYWWTVYNEIKHKRFEKTLKTKGKINYKFANQEYTLLALGGLYQVVVYAYYQSLKENKNRDTLTIMFAQKSKLFEMEGDFWKSAFSMGDLIGTEIV